MISSPLNLVVYYSLYVYKDISNCFSNIIYHITVQQINIFQLVCWGQIYCNHHQVRINLQFISLNEYYRFMIMFLFGKRSRVRLLRNRSNISTSIVLQVLFPSNFYIFNGLWLSNSSYFWSNCLKHYRVCLIKYNVACLYDNTVSDASILEIILQKKPRTCMSTTCLCFPQNLYSIGIGRWTWV